MNRALVVMFSILVSSAAFGADVWTCQAVCGSLTQSAFDFSSGSGGRLKVSAVIVVTGGSAGASATALEAYNAAAALCSSQSNGRMSSLGRIGDGGLLVFATVADVCVKNS